MGVRPGAIAHVGRPSSGLTTGKPVSKKRGGGGPPHWLMVFAPLGQLRGW